MTEPQLLGMVALIGVLSTIAGFLVGGALDEYWAGKREQRKENRRKARAAADRVRDDRLEMIDQTRRAMIAMLQYLSAKAGGNPEYGTSNPGLDKYPRLNMSLVDDPKVLEFYVALCADLAPRPFGSSFTSADNDRVATVQSVLQGVFERQRQRALADEELPMTADDDIGALAAIGTAYDAMGVPRPTTAGSSPEPER